MNGIDNVNPTHMVKVNMVVRQEWWLESEEDVKENKKNEEEDDEEDDVKDAKEIRNLVPREKTIQRQMSK